VTFDLTKQTKIKAQNQKQINKLKSHNTESLNKPKKEVLSQGESHTKNIYEEVVVPEIKLFK